MHNLRKTTFLVALAALLTLVLSTAIASAHERRDVASGAYQLVAGFMVEPPYEGQKNGVDFRITRKADNTPLTGAEATLKVDISYVNADKSVVTTKTFDLRTIFNDPGHYTVDLIPTQPGWYRMRFYGALKDGANTLPIDETFNSKSGGGGFNDVQSGSDLNFPDSLPTTREIVAATRGAQSTADAAQKAASDARTAADDSMTMAHSAQASADSAKGSGGNTLAIIAIVLGVVGAAAGVGGVALGLRKG